ncbi:hypothetical protein halTADL_0214 [Halohasta litchfieldiae]|uniref:Uncharacterized protein n=1 Tax=Halohasta litchfieldiae TaxID=1073996 RepID=A0A1H6T0X8_9EURY|nr:hypothetical protein halTADL_0214 [Halohasta litchfieldiae]SEI72876.1 hypothetical protein SAMN05444271_106144 [Halohasta litchfieldiae]
MEEHSSLALVEINQYCPFVAHVERCFDLISFSKLGSGHLFGNILELWSAAPSDNLDINARFSFRLE